MTNYKRPLGILLLAITTLLPIFGWAGGSAGGGGNACVSDNSVVLAELSDIKELPTGSGDQIGSSTLMEKVGADWLDHVSEMHSFRLAKVLLQEAETKSPQASSLISRALSNITFFATSFKPTRSYRASELSLCSFGQLLAAAIYRGREVIISRPLFNPMGLYSQAGLFIHEALRQVQIEYGAEGTDSDLEFITRQLVLNPKSAELDQHRFFKTLLVNDTAIVQAYDEMCAAIHGHANIYNQEIQSLISQTCDFNPRAERVTAKQHSGAALLIEKLYGLDFDSTSAHIILNDMDSINYFVTVVGRQLFSDQTLGIADSSGQFQSSIMTAFIKNLRAYADRPNSVKLSSQKRHELDLEMQQMKSSLKAIMQ